MLTPKDLASMKAFYENEYMVTVTKLKHIKKMLKKFDNVSENAEENVEKPAKRTRVKSTRRGRKPGRVKKALKPEIKKTVPAKKTAAVSGKRSYNKWSSEITALLKKEQKLMGVSEIVATCLKNKGITNKVEAARAAHSIRNLTYRLRNENEIREVKVKGSRGVLFGLAGWFKNGVLQDKFKQKK